MVGCAAYQASRFARQSSKPRTVHARSTILSFEHSSTPALGRLGRRGHRRRSTSKHLCLLATTTAPILMLPARSLAVAEAGIRAAGARVHPDLAVNAGYNRDPASHLEYGLVPAFTLETAGKRGYRILRAERQADAAPHWTLGGRLAAAQPRSCRVYESPTGDGACRLVAERAEYQG